MSFVMLIKRKKKMKRKKTSGKPFNEPNYLNRIRKKHFKKPVFFYSTCPNNTFFLSMFEPRCGPDHT